jgi:hypothetical protein
MPGSHQTHTNARETCLSSQEVSPSSFPSVPSEYPSKELEGSAANAGVGPKQSQMTAGECWGFLGEPV